MPISVETRAKNQLDPSEGSMEDAPLLWRYFLKRIPWVTPAGVLEHCHEEETNSYFSIFGAFTSDCITMREVHVHLFIHNFTFKDEIIIGKALAAPLQKNRKL